MENIVKTSNSVNSSEMTSVSSNAPAMALHQTVVKGGTTEQLFALMQGAIEKKPTAVIVTPRVDRASNAYYWVGVRFENREQGTGLQTPSKPADKGLYPCLPAQKQCETSRGYGLRARSSSRFQPVASRP